MLKLKFLSLSRLFTGYTVKMSHSFSWHHGPWNCLRVLLLWRDTMTTATLAYGLRGLVYHGGKHDSVRVDMVLDSRAAGRD